MIHIVRGKKITHTALKTRVPLPGILHFHLFGHDVKELQPASSKGLLGAKKEHGYQFGGQVLDSRLRILFRVAQPV